MPAETVGAGHDVVHQLIYAGETAQLAAYI